MRLADYFDWVKDAAEVNTAQALGIVSLAPAHWFSSNLQALSDVTAASNPSEPKSILWVRTDSIGDAVLASSMLPWIEKKYPGTKIAVLCQQHVADVYLAAPMISSVICVDRKRAEDEAYLKEIIGEIVEFNPDLVLNSTRSRDFLSELLTLAFQDARHIGIESDAINLSEPERAEAVSRYSQIIPSPGEWRPELERHHDFLAGLGLETPPLKPVVWTSTEDEAVAEAFFRQHRLDPARTIALFPGAQHDNRVYGGYGEALSGLVGFDWLVFGSAPEEALGKAIAPTIKGRVLNLCGRSSLRETAALLRRCRLYVGAESAGAHMASALGVPNVVVLGGGHFGRFMPWSPLNVSRGAAVELLRLQLGLRSPTTSLRKGPFTLRAD